MSRPSTDCGEKNGGSDRTVASSPPHRVLRTALIVVGGLSAAFVGLLIIASILGDSDMQSSAGRPSAGPAWALTPGDGQNLYAVATPSKATLNLKSVVLGCEIADGVRSLGLQLYPAALGPLLPNGASRSQIKDAPRIRLEIDGAVLPADIYFAGEFAVVADRIAGSRPVVTPALAEAMEKGTEMMLRFDLLQDQPGATPFDAFATVALKSPNGAKAIGAVRRRCGQ